jgi:uncharacterized tellurite resistance protein B-like protein
MGSLPMSLLTEYSQPIEERLVRLWNQDTRDALGRVLHEVYNADGKFTPLERADFETFLEHVGSDARTVQGLDLGASLALLEKDPVHRKVTYVWIAHALFADGGLNAAEKSFIERIIEKYGLDAARLHAEIKATQSRKIEEGMKAILAELGS